jgi:drug/metabolite transporter (DMT)-like permease
LVTFAAAALLLGERVSGIVVAGGILVLTSVLIAQYAPRIPQSLEEA